MRKANYSCILCSSSQRHPFIRKDYYTYVRCADCGLIYLNPRPLPEELSVYYNRDYLVNPTIYLRGRRDAEELLDYIECYRDKKGCLLEIGSSYGLFLDVARKRGWNVKGVEISKKAVLFAKREFHLDVFEGVLANSPFAQKSEQDVISAWHFLEHLPDPLEELKLMYRALKPGGLLVVLVPNINSLDFLWFGKFWGWISPPAHIYLFSPKTICALLKKVGFKVVEVRTGRWKAYNFLSQILLVGFVFLPLILLIDMRQKYKRQTSPQTGFQISKSSRLKRAFVRLYNFACRVAFHISEATEQFSPIFKPFRRMVCTRLRGPEILVVAERG